MFTRLPLQTSFPVELWASTLLEKENKTLAQNLWDNLPWEDRTQNRREVFLATQETVYTYGQGDFARTYISQCLPSCVELIKHSVEHILAARLDLCFANAYASEKEHLGWHSDDGALMDHQKPIAVVSWGATRQLWVKPKGATFDQVEKFDLPSGSLFVMKKGMQHSFVHRIPKHPSPCGFRVSLTFRGLL